MTIFCWQFDVLLCMTDQLWAWQDGWPQKRGSTPIFWGMGCISKIFFQKSHNQLISLGMAKICWFLVNFYRANFHLIFLLIKSYVKTWKQLSIIGFGWQRIRWVCLGFSYGSWRASIQQYILYGRGEKFMIPTCFLHVSYTFVTQSSLIK